mmetsp:Transcript_18517/g.25748  ORF Transcript_18517/g.25748 Transcript_18517/m.25748 type:complete len:241 (-) Transcript_18517:62-784(-)
MNRRISLCEFLSIFSLSFLCVQAIFHCGDATSALRGMAAVARTSRRHLSLWSLRGGKGAYGSKLKRNIKFRKFMYQVEGDYYEDENGKMKWEQEEEDRDKTLEHKISRWEKDQARRNIGREFAEHLTCIEHNQKVMSARLKEEERRKVLLTDLAKMEAENADNRRKKARINELIKQKQLEEEGAEAEAKHPAKLDILSALGGEASSSSSSDSTSNTEEDEKSKNLEVSVGERKREVSHEL